MTVPIHHRDCVAGADPQRYESTRQTADALAKRPVIVALGVTADDLLRRRTQKRRVQQMPYQQRIVIGELGRIRISHVSNPRSTPAKRQGPCGPRRSKARSMTGCTRRPNTGHAKHSRQTSRGQRRFYNHLHRWASPSPSSDPCSDRYDSLLATGGLDLILYAAWARWWRTRPCTRSSVVTRLLRSRPSNGAR